MHRNASLSRPERDKETLCVSRGPLTKPQGLLFTPPPIILNERREARAQKKQLFTLTNYSSEPSLSSFQNRVHLSLRSPGAAGCLAVFLSLTGLKKCVCACARSAAGVYCAVIQHICGKPQEKRTCAVRQHCSLCVCASVRKAINCNVQLK